MKAKRICVAVLAAAVITVHVSAGANEEESKVTIQQVDKQTVLYTIYRGPYERIGKAIEGLYALAGANQARPAGGPALVYLNNPQLTSPQHLLTEIRIPVSEDALKLAGTLGEMTDVKTVPAVEMAVITRQVGQMDYALLYNRLYVWIAEHGYRAIDNPCEVFSADMKEGGRDLINPEIMIPVEQTRAE